MRYKVSSIRLDNHLEIQEKAIELGFSWNNGDDTVHTDRLPFFYLNDESMKITWDSKMMGDCFMKDEAEYIPSNVFLMFGIPQFTTTPLF